MSLSIKLGRIGLLLPKLPSIGISIPSLLGGSEKSVGKSLQERVEEALKDEEDPFFIDNGFLRAVPKKKVTHQRKRRRQLAPGSKQLKYLHNLNRCPSCGHYKRSHTLCMHCVLQIKNLWRQDIVKEEIKQELDSVDEKLIYPGKHESEYEKELKKKEYVLKRQRTLPVERKS